MKLNTTTLVLGVALAVVAGLFGSTIFGTTGTGSNAQTSTAVTGLMTGHVTTTLVDSEGNVKAYRQSDNLIVNNGENCVSKMLFGAAGGATVGSVGDAGISSCNGAITQGFRYISIGNGSGTPIASDQNTLGSEHNTSTDATSLVPQFSSIVWTNSTGSANDNASTAQVVMEATFENSHGTLAVNESGLFNATETDPRGMFARQTFTPISMNNGDSLTVQWTINIGGTGGFSAPPP